MGKLDQRDQVEQAAQPQQHKQHGEVAPTPVARQLAGDRLALMGGTSNINLIRNGTAELITQDVQEKIAAGIDIIGPECAVPLDAPMKNLVWLAREAKRLGSNQS